MANKDDFYVPKNYDEDWPLPQWMEGDSLAPYQPCQPKTAQALLELARVSSSDVVYDLGCGDGRICIAAAKLFGAKAVGIEKYVVDKAHAAVKAADIGDKVTIRDEDLVTCPMDDCTVCVMFLLPEAMEAIKDKLQALYDRGVRIATVCWPIKANQWTPTAVRSNPSNNSHQLYLYEKSK